MRSLPIPVTASPALNATPRWPWRPHSPSFGDFFRAFFPGGASSRRDQIPHSWVSIQIVEFWWVRVSYVPQVQVLAVAPKPPVSPAPSPPKDPLVVDLDGLGPTTTGAVGARCFDLAGNGDPKPTSFVNGGSAFLALDRDVNGRIDSGKELFGDQHGAVDGYEELRKFDANHDALIDAKDPVFSRLQLLFGDGRLTAVSEAGLRAFSLNATIDGGRTLGGDPIFRHATALTTQDATLHTYALGLNQFPPASATIKPAPP